jgi:HD-GYP domain-containing protein (c-di-GMP phosphodiesterase class II)
VGTLAVNLGRECGVSKPDLSSLEWAGHLHDLGKRAVPSAILDKEGPLDESDWTEIKIHPVVGYQLLVDASPELHGIAVAVRAHHERWDGLGYPDGLSGDAIPYFGRIVAIADVYDALTTYRCYRERSYSHAEAIDLIVSGAGTHFDPTLVDVLLQMNRRWLVQPGEILKSFANTYSS